MSNVADALEGLSGAEATVATLLSVRFLVESHRRGPNPPLGLWVAELVPYVGGRVAAAAGTLARAALDREGRT